MTAKTIRNIARAADAVRKPAPMPRAVARMLNPARGRAVSPAHVDVLRLVAERTKAAQAAEMQLFAMHASDDYEKLARSILRHGRAMNTIARVLEGLAAPIEKADEIAGEIANDEWEDIPY